jgi:hypothetical protein
VSRFGERLYIAIRIMQECKKRINVLSKSGINIYPLLITQGSTDTITLLPGDRKISKGTI